MNTANFIIAGVNKAGTTSVFRYLAAHPDVCASNIKETCFFLPYRYNEPTIPCEQYSRHFSCTNARVLMESTPGYFYGGEALAGAIKQCAAPDVKILIILRDPVKRLISFYRFMISQTYIDKATSFSDYIDQCLNLDADALRLRKNNHLFGVEGGRYALYLEPWQRLFGNNLRIDFFENLCDNAGYFIQSTANWLGLDTSFYESFEFTVENKTVNYKNIWLQRAALKLNARFERFFSGNHHVKRILRDTYYSINGATKSPFIDPDSVQRMYEYYEPDNRSLRQILTNINATLPKWLAPDNTKSLLGSSNA